MTTNSPKLQNIKTNIKETIHSSKGKDLVVFIILVCVSYIFWLLLTLNIEVQQDIDINLELTDKPDSVTLINDVPKAINVSVRDKGSALIKYVWGESPTMKIRFEDYDNGNNRIIMGESDINSRIRSFFSPSSQIISSRPDSINIYYTTKHGKKAIIEINADVLPALQYTITGNVTANTDSVTIYSISDLPLTLNSVKTESIVRSNLKDTTYIDVGIVPIPGTRIIPDRVTLCIPVEPLIAKKHTITINPINVPVNSELITFPSNVEISYLIPMNRYNEDFDVKAYANYNDATGSKIPVSTSMIPEYITSFSFSPDSVEYIIGQK